MNFSSGPKGAQKGDVTFMILGAYMEGWGVGWGQRPFLLQNDVWGGGQRKVGNKLLPKLKCFTGEY